MDTQDYAERLRLSNILREPAVKAAIDELRLPVGSRGLDLGCGIGLHTTLLAQAVGASGQVVGLDLEPEFLALAAERAAQTGLAGRLRFQQGDMTRLPFEDGSFDWLWSCHPATARFTPGSSNVTTL